MTVPSFTTVFGSSILQPADLDYYLLELIGQDIQLYWPQEAPPGLPVVARVTVVDAFPAGNSVLMPDATLASVGQVVTFVSSGASQFYVKDKSGNVLLNVASGTAWTLILETNSTSAGAWRSFQQGALVSQAQAAALAGAGLVVLGGTLGRAATVNSTAVTPTNLSAASRATVQRWTGGAGTFTFDAAATLGQNWLIEVRNDGSGNLTLDPNGAELINGAATLILSPGDSCEVHCDGAALYTVGLGKSAVVAFDLDTVAVGGGAGDFTLAGSDLNRIGYKFTGVLTGNRNVIVPNTIQQYWVDNETTGAFTLTVKTAAGTGITVTQTARAVLYCDGVNVVNSDTQGLSFPIAIAQGGTGAVNAAAARSNLGSTAVGDALFIAATAAAARATLGSGAIGDPLFTAGTAAGARATIDAASLGTANAFTAAQTATIAALTAIIQEVCTDAGAAESIALDLYRNSASPAANDLLESIIWSANSSTAVKRTVAKLLVKLLDATNTSEDAEIEHHTIVAGADNTAMVVGQGLRVGTPTDGDMGTGWGNFATGLAQNGLPIMFKPVSTNKSAAYNVAKLDCGGIFRWTTAGFTATLLAATVINGFTVGIVNEAASGDVTISPASGTINGQASITVPPGYGVWVSCDGTNYKTTGVITGPGIPIGRTVAVASATLQLSFASVLSWAREINFRGEDLVPATNAVDAYLRVSTDGGATYDAGASTYEWFGFISNTAGGTSAPGSTGDTKIRVSFNTVPNVGTNGKVQLRAAIANPKRAARPLIDVFSTQYPTSATALEGGYYKGTRLTDHSIDGIQILFSAGNITSGALEAWWN